MTNRKIENTKINSVTFFKLIKKTKKRVIFWSFCRHLKFNIFCQIEFEKVLDKEWRFVPVKLTRLCFCHPFRIPGCIDKLGGLEHFGSIMKNPKVLLRLDMECR